MPVGRTKDVGWEIGVSRTIDFPINAVWELLASERGTAIWLGAGVVLEPTVGTPYESDDGLVGEVRGFRPLERIRLTYRPADWDHDSTAQVAMVAKGARTMLRFHQERLVDADERERQRTHWSSVLERIVEELAAAKD